MTSALRERPVRDRRLVRPILLPTLVAIGFGVLVVPGYAAPLASSERQAGAGERQEILDFWTRERMREAEPLEQTLPNGDPPERAPIDESGSPGTVPPADPRAADGDAPAVLPESGRSAAAVEAKGFESGPVAADAEFPQSTNGKVFGRMRGVGTFQCSGTVVRSESRSLVFTAGHCVKEPGGRWASDFVFVPSYRQGARPFGSWVWRRAIAPAEWTRRGNFNFDYGAVTLGRRGGVPVEQAVGGQGFAWGQTRRRTYRAIGYPVNRLGGQQMWNCRSGYAGADPGDTRRGPPPMGIGCDMGPGASGGGWAVTDGRGRQYVNSVSSFTYSTVPDVLFGPYFGDAAHKLWRRAGGVR